MRLFKRAGKTQNNSVLWQYTLFFITIALISFSMFIIFGKTFLIENDGFMQHYPLLVKLRMMVRNVLNGQGVPFWDHTIGWGNETIGNLSIIFMDPFNYIAAAFPVPYMDIGYSIAIILRMYAAGLAMIAFLRYHQYSSEKVIIGGLSYAFSYWAVGVINHNFFLLPLIIFPLVILGIDRVFDHKSPTILIASIAASFLTYVYFAYMTGIGCLIYVIVKSFMGKDKKNPKEFIILILKFSLYIIIACCIASPILVTMVYTLFNASKDSGLYESNIPGLKELMRFIPGILGNYEIHSNYSFIGTNAVMTAVIPLIVTKGWKRNRVPVFMFLAFLIAVEIPLWGQIMNGFSYRTGRWCYMLVFFFVYAAIDNFDYLSKLDNNDIKAGLTWIGILLLFSFVSKIILQTITLSSCVLILWNIGCLLFIYFYGFYKPIHILPVLILNISIGYCLVFSPFTNEHIYEYTDQGKPYEAYKTSVLRGFGKLNKEDKGLFRVDYNQHLTQNIDKYIYACTPANEQLFWNAKTLSGYLSTTNQDILDFNRSMINNPGFFRRVYVYSVDNRKILNQLLGVKYYLYEPTKKLKKKISKGKVVPEALKGDIFIDGKTKNGVRVSKSKWNTSIGYIYDYVIDEKDFELMSPIDKEMLLSKAVVIQKEKEEKEDISVPSIPIQKSEVTKVPYKKAEDSDIDPQEKEFKVGIDEQIMELDFSVKNKSEIYVQFTNLTKKQLPIDEKKEIYMQEDLNKTDWAKIDDIRYDIEHFEEKRNNYFEFIVMKGNVGKRQLFSDKDPQGIIDNHNYLSYVGPLDKGSGKVKIRFLDPGQYQFDELKILSVPSEIVDQRLHTMSTHVMKNITYGNDYVKGKVNSDKNSMLFLSIPYHPGWKAWVDGKKVDIKKVNYCFSGIFLTPGKHSIYLSFRPIGFTVCLILMAAGVLFTIILHFVSTKYNNNEKSSLVNREKT